MVLLQYVRRKMNFQGFAKICEKKEEFIGDTARICEKK